MDYYDPELNLDFGDALISATNKMGEWRDNYGFAGREVLETKKPRSRGKGPTQPAPGRGISWHKDHCAWVAQVSYYEDGVRRKIYIGEFPDTPEGILEAKEALRQTLDHLVDDGKKSYESRIKYAA